MYLQLAESKYTQVTGYKRKANKVKTHKRRLSEDMEPTKYIYIPQFLTVTPETPNGLPTGINVREDYFDKLNNAEYNELMTILAPYQQGLNEMNLLSSRAERRAKREARREKRQQNKEERKANRKEAFSKIIDTVGTVAGKFFGTTPELAPTDQVPAETPKPWYQNPAVIIGGVVIIGGLVYFGMKKK
jgi:transketolase